MLTLGRAARLEPFGLEPVESLMVERLMAGRLADKSHRGPTMKWWQLGIKICWILEGTFYGQKKFC